MRCINWSTSYKTKILEFSDVESYYASEYLIIYFQPWLYSIIIKSFVIAMEWYFYVILHTNTVAFGKIGVCPIWWERLVCFQYWITKF